MLFFLDKNSSNKGFSVVELAIVLVIIGLLIAMIGSGVITYVDISNKKTTQSNINLIKESLKTYKKEYGRLPCPADPSKDIKTATDYGDEEEGCDAYDCSTGWLNGSWTGACVTGSDLVRGMVPVKALGLSNQNSLDGWGNKITYVVEKSQVKKYCSSNGQTNRSIVILDTASEISTNAVSQPFCYTTSGSAPSTIDSTNISRLGSPAFLLLSHGENESGGWDKNGTPITCTASATNYYDDENCDDDNFFVDSLYSDSDVRRYDDIISWHHNDVGPICPAGVEDCIAWIDASDRCSMAVADTGSKVPYIQDKLTRTQCSTAPSTSVTDVPEYDDDAYNGLPGLVFDSGYDNVIDLHDAAIATDSFEIFIVARTDNDYSKGATDQRLIVGQTEDSVVISIGDDEVGLYESDEGTLTSKAVLVGSSNKIMLVRVKYDTRVPTIYINEGNSITKSASSGPIYLELTRLGNPSLGYEGTLFEVLAYDRVLEENEATKISRYLKDKWKIEYDIGTQIP